MYIRNAEKESRELMLSFGNKTVSPTSRSLVPRTPEIAFAPPRKGDMKKERDYPLLSPFLILRRWMDLPHSFHSPLPRPTHAV